MNSNKIFAFCFVILIISVVVNSRTIGVEQEENYEEPGFWRRQLSRASGAASSVGNAFGSTTMKISAAMEKICTFVKKIVPIVGAICTVGQFKFCGIEDAAIEVMNEGYIQKRSTENSGISEALGYEPVNLDVQD